MKTYIFAHGRVDAENLSGHEIKAKETQLGRLNMVVIGYKKIPVDYHGLQKPFEELAMFKKEAR